MDTPICTPRRRSTGFLVAVGAILSCPALAAAQPGSASLVKATYLTTEQTADISPQQFTLEAWIRPDGPGYGNTQDTYGAAVIAKPRQGTGGTSLSSWALHWSPVSQRVVFVIGHVFPSVQTTVFSQTLVPIGTPAHVAATFDGVTARLYVNGVLDTSTPAVQSGVFYFPQDPVLIGASNYCCGYLRRWQGLIDDVRIWDVALSDEQIEQHAACQLEPGPRPGLLANWVFDDESPADVSGNLRDASFLAGTPAFGPALADAPPTIVSPEDVRTCPTATASFSVRLNSPPVFSFQWQVATGVNEWTGLKDGPLMLDGEPTCATVSGAASPMLSVALACSFGADRINGLRVRCVVSNLCSSGESTPATLQICRSDFNCDGATNSQDFFDFLGAFFTRTKDADFNHDGIINTQDFFDFLTVFFGGC